MLIISRKVHEAIEIRPACGSDTATLEQVFAPGTIRIELLRIGPTRVKIAVDAPRGMRIRRDDRHERD